MFLSSKELRLSEPHSAFLAGSEVVPLSQVTFRVAEVARQCVMGIAVFASSGVWLGQHVRAMTLLEALEHYGSVFVRVTSRLYLFVVDIVRYSRGRLAITTEPNC